MELSEKTTLLRLVTRVGLVLAGLLAGILIMQIVSHVGKEPSVDGVTVQFHTIAYPPESTGYHLEGVNQLNEQFKKVSSDVKRAVVSVHAESSWSNLPCNLLGGRTLEYRERESLGSGVLISPQGYIVTNYHVIEDACGMRVTFVDKEEFDAEVVGVDPSTDLAVLKIELEEGAEVMPVRLGSPDNIQTGEWVLAVGNPLALTSTVTAGIVSALGRRVDVIQDAFNIESFIQTDAAISPGNSGGALVNLKGELIGINTAIATQTGYNEGYGFAIPIGLVQRVVTDLIAYGKVQRAYMGVRLESIDAEFAQELGMESVQGVLLDAVRRKGAAYAAGLRVGDVVLEVDKQPVNEPNELQRIIAQHHPGDKVIIKVWRRKETRFHIVTLASEEDPDVTAWINSV